MIFDRLIVAVTQNIEKEPLFTVEERLEMLKAVTFDWANVEVDMFDGLLVDYARAQEARVMLRGIRAVSDYEYELQMAMMNRKIEPQMETVFMLPARGLQLLEFAAGEGAGAPGRPVQRPGAADGGGAAARES